jgi:hypothetical protein
VETRLVLAATHARPWPAGTAKVAAELAMAERLAPDDPRPRQLAERARGERRYAWIGPLGFGGVYLVTRAVLHGFHGVAHLVAVGVYLAIMGVVALGIWLYETDRRGQTVRDRIRTRRARRREEALGSSGGYPEVERR